MPTSATRSFRLAGHLVEPELGVVHGPGGETHVDPKAMHLLLRLAEDPGRLVVREELVRQIWDGAPGGDASLTTAVSHLRQALADDRANPRFIETRRNQGYRLLVEPEPVERRTQAGQARLGNSVVDLARVFQVDEGAASTRVSRLRARLLQILVDLKKRKIVQWVFAYLAAAWASLQALDLVADSYAWPQLVMRLSFELAALGFAVMLVLAWYHGERGAQRVSGAELVVLAALIGLGGSLVLRSSLLEDSLAVAVNPAATADDAAAGRIDARATGLGKAVIAVLPFSERGPPGSDYLGEGLADELIARLAQVPGLAVMARSSSFSFAGEKPDIPAIAKLLGAGLVISGELQVKATEVDLLLRVVDAAGREIFVKTYSEPRDAILSLQSAITADVIKGLRQHLDVAIGKLGKPAGMTSNNAAFLIYLRARHYLAGSSESDLRQGLLLLLKAVALDSKFAHAYEGLAVTYRRMAELGGDSARVAELEKLSVHMAQEALAVDDTLAEAYLINGDGEGDHEMERYHEWGKLADVHARVIDLERNNPTLRLWYASFLQDSGYLNDATWEVAIASRLDPMNPHVNRALAWAYYLNGQMDAALKHALYSAGPEAGAARLLAARIELERQNYAQARAILDAVPAGELAQARWLLLTVDALEHPEDRQTVLEQIDAALRASPRQIGLSTAFESYAYLKETGKALAVLEQALAPDYKGEPEYFHMWAPAFGYLRETAGFHDLMERIGLAEFWRTHGWPDYCKPKDEDFRCF